MEDHSSRLGDHGRYPAQTRHYVTAGNPDMEHKKNILTRESMPVGRMWWMIGLTVYAIAMGGSAQRIVPGGPFISTMSDIIPVLASVVVFLLGLSTFRTKQFTAKILGMVSIVICCCAVNNVVTSVMWFWVRPAARGDFIGW